MSKSSSVCESVLADSILPKNDEYMTHIDALMELYSEDKIKRSSLVKAKNHINNFQSAFLHANENHERLSIVSNYFDFK